MTTRETALLVKTRIFTAIVILTNVLGNFALSLGLRRGGSLLAASPMTYITTLFHPLVAVGVSLLIVWLFTHMTLLSWADLSYVLPVTSIGYVMTAVAGRFFLHEQVSLTRWAGIGLIVLGVLMVSRTSPSTKTSHTAKEVPQTEKAAA